MYTTPPFSDFDESSFQRIGRFARWVGRWYFRYELRGMERLPDEPCLVVGNHSGFGIVEELMLVGEWSKRNDDRRAWGLVHDLFYGHYYRALGAIPASRENARTALRNGDVVLVFPGGDVDCCRPFYQPHTVDFAGRRGYVQLALEEGVPVVPLATVGSHWTWTFLPGGRLLAKLPGVRRLFRADIIPLPTALFGFLAAIAGVAFLGWPAWMAAVALVMGGLPTPVRVTSEIGAPIDLATVTSDTPGEEALEIGHRAVHGRLQAAVEELATSSHSDEPSLEGYGNV